MSKENLESYELFFAEIPSNNNDDFLTQIISDDDANANVLQEDSNSGLSYKQVKQISQDVREYDSTLAPIVPIEGTLFSEQI